MNQAESKMLQSARWLTFGSATSILLGIAPSQILLALSLAALLAGIVALSAQEITLPGKPDSVKIAIIGDSGTGSSGGWSCGLVIEFQCAGAGSKRVSGRVRKGRMTAPRDIFSIGRWP